MYLTKIVLPTFILERRSLLEMYADFFAHPDIFVEIAEKKTPEERMVQVRYRNMKLINFPSKFSVLNVFRFFEIKVKMIAQ